MLLYTEMTCLQPRHLARPGQAGEALLLQGLIGEDGDGVREVQAARFGAHGQADAAVGVRKAERLGQPRRLLAEEEPAVTRQVGLTVILRGLGGGEPEVLLRFRVLREERGQIFIVAHGDEVPVIQPRALDGAVGNIEAERADEVEVAAGCGTGARDIPAILRNFRFYEYDMDHFAAPSFLPP